MKLKKSRQPIVSVEVSSNYFLTIDLDKFFDFFFSLFFLKKLMENLDLEF